MGTSQLGLIIMIIDIEHLDLKGNCILVLKSFGVVKSIMNLELMGLDMLIVIDSSCILSRRYRKLRNRAMIMSRKWSISMDLLILKVAMMSNISWNVKSLLFICMILSGGKIKTRRSRNSLLKGSMIAWKSSSLKSWSSLKGLKMKSIGSNLFHCRIMNCNYSRKKKKGFRKCMKKWLGSWTFRKKLPKYLIKFRIRMMWIVRMMEMIRIVAIIDWLNFDY